MAFSKICLAHEDTIGQIVKSRVRYGRKPAEMPKLTDAVLAKLTVEAGRKDRLVFDTACPGLGVRVTTAGTRTFVVQWTRPDRP